MRSRSLLPALLSLSVLGACGSPPPAARPEVSPAPGSTSAAPVASASGSPAATPSGSGTASVAPKPELPDHNTHIRASTQLAGVQQIGVDLRKPLSTLTNAKKKELMKLFVTSLGYEGCEGCHVGDDYEKETRNVKITRKMWETFVMPLRDAQGGTLFCDSCHAGKAKPLDRANMDALQKLMETDYQGKLTRADKKEHDCSTCHGAGAQPEPKIIEKLWGIKAK
jgi:hypothetical protein